MGRSTTGELPVGPPVVELSPSPAENDFTSIIPTVTVINLMHTATRLLRPELQAVTGLSSTLVGARPYSSVCGEPSTTTPRNTFAAHGEGTHLDQPSQAIEKPQFRW